jgi:acetoacetyl-CoA synthetase
VPKRAFGDQVRNASPAVRLTDFQAFLNAQHRLSFDSYDQLHQWSVDAPATFWQAVWDFSEVRVSVAADAVLLDADRFPGARWFDGARLNYAENLLNRRTEGVAIIGRLENGERREISWPQLHAAVACAAAALRASGVGVGDRVAGMLPNVPETIIAMLATASIGALWSSCSPDFGVQGMLDRFGQIEPRVLVVCDGYWYNGKSFDVTDKIAEVAAKLPSVEKIIVIDYLGHAQRTG